jgi:radical SAM superfamily enzyme YgiQ (UPF0313 family)
MAKKLLLIHPVDNCFRDLNKELSVRLPPLGLGIIASLTPSDWEIEILDENFDDFVFKPADFVGITAFSATVVRAYEIAAVYKEKGIPTVMGGIHASMMIDEALQNVDCVVVGEAESIWPTVIKDFESGNLQKVYRGELMDFHDRKWPVPRHDLFHKNYKFRIVQTTRGCPMKCHYCSVSLFNGYKYRQRPIDEIIDELKMLNHRYINFVDDNIIGYGPAQEKRAIELFKRIIDENIKIDWISHTSINIADNEELMTYAAKSGCRIVFIGFEVEKEEYLKDINKKINTQIKSSSYHEIIKKLNKHNIAVTGGFMVGFDFDTAKTVDDRRRFILKSGVNIMGASIITPFPGTVMHKQFMDEGRILKTNYPHDWQYYNYREVVIKPKNMTVEELENGILSYWSSFFSIYNIIRSALIILFRSRNIDTMLWVFLSCVRRRRVIKHFRFVAHKDKSF